MKDEELNQEGCYSYGWQSFLHFCKSIDEEFDVAEHIRQIKKMCYDWKPTAHWSSEEIETIWFTPNQLQKVKELIDPTLIVVEEAEEIESTPIRPAEQEDTQPKLF